jgi:hypothetical protein
MLFEAGGIDAEVAQFGGKALGAFGFGLSSLRFGLSPFRYGSRESPCLRGLAWGRRRGSSDENTAHSSLPFDRLPGS